MLPCCFLRQKFKFYSLKSSLQKRKDKQRQNSTWKHLAKICSGEITSQKHKLPHLGRFLVNSDLENLANSDFLENDEDLEHDLYIEAEKNLQLKYELPCWIKIHEGPRMA